MTALLHPPRGVVGGALSGQRGTSGERAGLLGCEGVGGEQGADGRGGEALGGVVLLLVRDAEGGEGGGGEGSEWCR